MLNPGDRIDIWVVDKSLGSGGMGSVYRCHNASATRILAAVKVLEGHMRHSTEMEARFIREAEILFQLDHPNIVKVRNIRTDTDPPYLEMEFIEGESLERRLQRGAIPYDETRALMAELTAAVAYLHGKSVRHRDIKPANVLINREGSSKLVDFGLAMESDQTRLTQSGMAFGTVSYAPPEWVTPDKMDPAKWDIYALGVMFWEMLTGHVAFPVSGEGSARQQAMQVIIGKQTAAPLDPGDVYHDDLRELLRRMTHKDPGQRPEATEALRMVRALIPSLRSETGAIQEIADGPTQARVTHTVRPEQHVETGPVTGPQGRTQPYGEQKTRPIPPKKPAKRGTSPLIVVGAGVALGVMLFAVVLVVAIIAVQLGKTATDRDVAVTIAGPPVGTPLSIGIGGILSVSHDAQTWQFNKIPLGPAPIAWAIGEGCDVRACPGDRCPSWCGHGTEGQIIEGGAGSQAIALTLPNLPSRVVKVSTPKVPATWKRQATLGDKPGVVRDDGSIVFEAVPPGQLTLVATIGECPDNVSSCAADKTCPPGCARLRTLVAVPWGDGDYSHELDLDEPAPVAAIAPVPVAAPVGGPKPGPKPGPAPAPAPAPSGGGKGGGIVTNGQLAKWLANNADWQREAVIVEGTRGDNNYLKGWTGATPPPGTEGSPAISLSWYGAAAYCASRGGLADVDAEPQTWSEGAGQPMMEWRVKGGKALWRSNDGRTSIKATVMKGSNTMTGFRCAK